MNFSSLTIFSVLISADDWCTDVLLLQFRAIYFWLVTNYEWEERLEVKTFVFLQVCRKLFKSQTIIKENLIVMSQKSIVTNPTCAWTRSTPQWEPRRTPPDPSGSSGASTRAPCSRRNTWPPCRGGRGSTRRCSPGSCFGMATRNKAIRFPFLPGSFNKKNVFSTALF